MSPLQGLEDCPRPHELALRGEDIAHMKDFLADVDQRARADRGRCAPAKRECVSACAAYTARCAKPYVVMHGCVRRDEETPSEYCDGACDGGGPYLKVARFFDGAACGRSAAASTLAPAVE